jgi:phage terminase small subunit
MYTVAMTPLQREFAKQYALNPTASAAALAAGYSKSYASGSHPPKLLKNPLIIDEIQRIRRGAHAITVRSAADVVDEYSKIAFTDLWEFFKDDPDFPGRHVFKSPDELTPDQRAVCISIKPIWRTRKLKDEHGNTEEVHRQEWDYRFADKESALQQMGRHFGIFDDKLKLTTARSNPFKNATPEQLEKLKASWVKTMNDGNAVIDGKFKEVKQ